MNKDAMPPENERPIAVKIKEDYLHVILQDGRVISTPLQWYPRLMSAKPDELTNVELGYSGIHFPDVDEDLSIAAMLRGQPAIGSTKLINE